MLSSLRPLSSPRLPRPLPPASITRQDSQANRIEQGRKTGKITWTEGLKLRAEQKRIANKEAQFKSDGYLSKSERRQLRYLQNDAAEHIADEKSDARRRAWWLPRVGK